MYTWQGKKIALVGGSAGSLAPLQELFETLRCDRGLTCFVIQHLCPEHQSQLDNLLSKWTSMPVAWALEGTRLQEGHVYPCLPGKLLSIEDNTLHLRQPGSPGETHKPIDYFARSLVSRFGSDVVLVILSGTGNDGTEGAKAVKAAGGIVIAQLPESAKFPDMPSSLIKADLADLALPPADIAEDLCSRCEMGFVEHTTGASRLNTDETLFATILKLVREHSNKDMTGYKPSTLRRRIDRRMSIRHVRDLAAYLEILRSTPAELDHLSKDMLIGVTFFFRDVAAFRFMEESVIPKLCEAKSGSDPVRVWIAGCSTGEEAYSIAILLMEWFLSRDETPRIQIFATDIDDRSLEVARSGIYGKQSLAKMTPERLRQFFTEYNGGYCIAKSIRETIVFASHNLISDPPFSKLDLVVCRNVLIYLNSTTQRKLLSLFHFVLNPGGFMFLGSSESIGSVGRHFQAISKQWRIFRHLPTGNRRPPLLPITVGVEPRRLLSGVEAVPDLGAVAGQERLYHQLLQSHGPTQVLINARFELLYVSGDVTHYLTIPMGQASHDILKMVKPSLAMGLRSALNDAQRSHAKSAVKTVRTETEQRLGTRIDVTPIATAEHQELLLVCFSTEASSQSVLPATELGGDDWVLRQLLQELNATREDLHLTLENSRISGEEMRAANEEVMAMNEELQSANEELESSREELQSLNEELVGSNSLLDAKVLEVEALNADLSNLLNSTNTATLLVDAGLCIRRFTPACSKLMRVIPTDIGRSIDDVVRIIDYPRLSDDCLQVIHGNEVPEKEVNDANGHWYLCRILPFLEADERIAGTVITFTEITNVKRTDHLLHKRAEQLQWQSNLLSRAAPIIGMDMRDRIVYWNKGAEELYGWTDKEALGQVTHDLLHTSFSFPREEIMNHLSSNAIWRGELSHLCRDGHEIVVDSQWTIYRDEKGEPLAIVEVNNDITERKLAQEALRESEAILHTMVDWTYNWEYWIDQNGKFVYMTPSAERVTGYRREEFKENPGLLDAIVYSDDIPAWKRHIDNQNEYQDQEIREIVIRIVRKNGDVEWINHIRRPLVSESGQYLGQRVTVRDITAQKQAEQQIHTLAYYDPLTHLPNRRLFMDRLNHALKACKRSRQCGAVMILDLDHFKSLNDTQGHDVGDSLLMEAAKRLLSTTRAQDTVSRIGGDEFVVMLENLGEVESVAAARAETIAEKIRYELARPYVLGANKLDHFTSTSIGVTVYRDEIHSPDLLLKQADVALYQAKDAGRDTVRYFNPDMQAAINARTEMEAALRRALKNDEFILHYQPHVDRDGNLIGAEALIRWKKRKNSLVMPDQFIPLAEDTGLIVQIGQWVLRTACLQLKQWEGDPLCSELYLSINVSARQLRQPDFVKSVVDTIQVTAANPAYLKLELTESAILENVRLMTKRMRELIALGISFSLDDFGTGYSSLSYLKLLPLSQVKIDRSFIRDVNDDPNDAAIVMSILALNKTLGLPVLAEGVETREQYAFLREHGCAAYQGYFFSPPIPIEGWKCDAVEM